MSVFVENPLQPDEVVRLLDDTCIENWRYLPVLAAPYTHGRSFYWRLHIFVPVDFNDTYQRLSVGVVTGATLRTLEIKEHLTVYRRVVSRG